jgi:transcriptional regulator with XRE-family HTH domain
MAVTAGTPRTRALAAALRGAREAAVPPMGVRELARRIGVTHPTVSNWETGKRVPRPEDVARVLTAIGVIGDECERIIQLAHGANEPNWLATGIPGVSEQLAGMMECERTATTITDWSPLVIPGLLQTGDYARAVIGSSNRPAGEVEGRVLLRMGRRDVLTRRDPVVLTALIGEAAIRQRVGGVQVMADQLRHVVKAVSEMENVTVRVVPLGGDWHPGLMGPFILFDFAKAPSIVHLEHHRSSVFLYDDEDVLAYKDAAATLRRVAMSPADSAGLITQAINAMETEIA